MNLDFTSSNRAVVRSLQAGEGIVAQNNAGEAQVLLVPATRAGTVNVSNEGKGNLIVEHCREQVVVASGEAKDLTVTRDGLVDPSALKMDAAPMLAKSVKASSPPAPFVMSNAPIRKRA